MSDKATPDPQDEERSIADLFDLEGAPVLLTTTQIASLLGVRSQTVLNWIESEEIPAIKLPGGTGQRRKFRVPMRGLLRTLSVSHSMDESDLRDIVEAAKMLGDNS